MGFTKNSYFPGLETAMDIKSVLASVREILKKDYPHLDIIDGKIADVKYNSDSLYVLLYHLKVQNNLMNRKRKILVTARVFGEKEVLPQQPSIDELNRYKNLSHLWIQTPLILLPRQKIALYLFPNDLELPWLIDAIDPNVIKQKLNRLWAFQNIKVRKVKIHTLGYTPHMRASFQYDVLIENKNTKERQWWHFIGKTNAFKQPDRLFAGAWALWQACQGQIQFARPIGFLMHPRLTLQEKIKGNRLGRLVDSPSFETIIQKTAHAIAKFHSLSIPLRTKRKLKDEIESIERWSNTLVEIKPDLKERVELLRDKLKSEITFRTSIRSPVHADFHHTNVFVEDDQIKLIDLDEMAYGDPCVDIGRFLASLRIPSLRAFGNIRALDNHRELFLQEYLKIRQEDIPNIRLFESASLVTSAASAFRIQRPNWKNEIEILLDEAEKVYDCSSNTTAVSFTQAKHDALQIPGSERLRWALDETFMQAVLSPFVLESYDVELVRSKVMKSKKTGTGHRIRYKLSGWKGDHKWKTDISAVILEKRGGWTIFSRLSILRKHLQKVNSRLLLPRPIAYVPQIAALILEPVKGKSFASLIRTLEITDSVHELANVLSSFHKIEIEPDKIRSTEQELEVLNKKLVRLKNERPDFYSKAKDLYSEIQKNRINKKTSPIIYNLGLRHIFLSGNQISLQDITKLRFSHPLIDVGNFITQLILEGIKSEKIEEVTKAVEGFRISYRSATQVESGELLAFEIIALLRVACAQLQKNNNVSVAFKLLDYLEERIAQDG